MGCHRFTGFYYIGFAEVFIVVYRFCIVFQGAALLSRIGSHCASANGLLAFGLFLLILNGVSEENVAAVLISVDGSYMLP